MNTQSARSGLLLCAMPPSLGQAARKHAPSNHYNYEADSDEYDEADDEVIGSDSGRVVHLGSDLPNPDGEWCIFRQ